MKPMLLERAYLTPVQTSQDILCIFLVAYQLLVAIGKTVQRVFRQLSFGAGRDGV